MSEIVATNVIASRPPKRQPTGTPHARANNSTESKTVREASELKNVTKSGKSPQFS